MGNDGIKSNFILYFDGKSRMKSTVFDLISGDKETKQTKGLAYLFSLYPNFAIKFAQRFINLPDSRILINISHIDVTAEEFTIGNNPKRADIIIKFFNANNLKLAVVIEAKSINAGSVQKEKLEKQIKYYIKNIVSIKNAEIKAGVVLTKYKYDIKDITCLDWNDIINFIDEYYAKNKKDEILKDYSEFLININKNMVIYDAEVASIPAGASIKEIEKNYIYECPNTSKFNYKKAMFMAFREGGGGRMKMLYKVKDIIILNASILKQRLEDGEKILVDLDIDNNVKERIINYIKSVGVFIDEEKKFYILSTKESKENIELKHNPRPKRNNSFTAYYSLAHLLLDKNNEYFDIDEINSSKD